MNAKRVDLISCQKEHVYFLNMIFVYSCVILSSLSLSNIYSSLFLPNHHSVHVPS